MFPNNHHRKTILLLILLTIFWSLGSLPVSAQSLAGPESVMGLHPPSEIQPHHSASDYDSFLTWSQGSPSLSPLAPYSENILDRISLSWTEKMGPAFLYMSFQNRAEDIHGSVGGSFDKFRFIAHYGDSEGILSFRPEIYGVAPNFFHGSVSYPYQYTGATVNYAWSDKLRFHLGNFWIQSRDLEDRIVHFGGFDYKNISASLAGVQRDTESVGYRLGLEYRWQDLSIAYQQIVSNYDATWREVSFALNGIDTSGVVQLNLGMGENDRYSDISETRITLTYSIPWGGSKKRKAKDKKYQKSHFGSNLSGSSKEFNGLTRSGLSAVGTGLVLSSGSPVLDRSFRFPGQHSAAIFILSRLNPISVADNREYGSSIYQNRDGSYAPSRIVIAGTVDSVSFNPHTIIPPGTWSTAYWHTHGADIPGYLSEQFSTADLLFAWYYGVDGYLGTPQGRAFTYDLSQGAIYQLYGLDGTETFLPH